MVRRTPLLALVALTFLLIACGGDDSSTPSQTNQPTPRPTSAATPSGPTAVVDPRHGPPGSQITVSGASWPSGVLIDVTAKLSAGVSADPFATTTTDQSGNFSVSFRLEENPDGSELQVGGYNLIVRGGDVQVGVPFLIETRRPIQNQGQGG